MVINAVPLILGWQAHWLASLLSFPTAKSPRLVVVRFHRPVPGHGHFFGKQSKFPRFLRIGITHPESGVRGLGKLVPTRAFFIPIACIGVTTSIHKFQKLTVADQILSSLKRWHIGLVTAILIVPAVNRLIQRTSQHHAACGYINQFISRCIAGFLTWLPGRVSLHIVQGVLPHQHRRGFQVNMFMLNPHHHRPKRIIPADRQGKRRVANHLVNHLPSFVAVGPHLLNSGPIIAGIVQIVPTHFIHTHCEHGFQARINSLIDQPHQQKFINKKSGRVAKIKNQWVAQADRLFVISLITAQQLKKRLMAIKTRMKVLQQLAALGFNVATCQTGCAKKVLALGGHVLKSRIHWRKPAKF